MATQPTYRKRYSLSYGQTIDQFIARANQLKKHLLAKHDKVHLPTLEVLLIKIEQILKYHDERKIIELLEGCVAPQIMQLAQSVVLLDKIKRKNQVRKNTNPPTSFDRESIIDEIGALKNKLKREYYQLTTEERETLSEKINQLQYAAR